MFMGSVCALAELVELAEIADRGYRTVLSFSASGLDGF